ncbi:YdcF family protein [Pseudochelatococcus sp. B33]
MSSGTDVSKHRKPAGRGFGGRPFLFARRISRGLVLLSVAAGIVLGGGFLGFVQTLKSYKVDTRASADGIVVLTGGSQRIADAAALLADGRARRMLITGVNEATTREEIAVKHPVVAGQGCCVDLDYRALNTVGNAIETRRWVESNNFHSLIVVTSTYHMPRTLLELKNVLPDVTLTPYPVVAPQSNGNDWLTDSDALRFLLWEYVKYVAAFTRTSVESDPEHSPFVVLFGGRKPLS